MKYTILLPVLFFSLSASAQKSEGSIRYLVSENWTKMMASLKYISKQQKERQQYMWGDREEWKTYEILFFNERETKYIKSDEKADPRDDGTFSERKAVYEFRRNLEKNTATDALEIFSKSYIIEDSLVKPEWKILNDIKDVAGHLCMKAQMNDTLRLEKIVAWFAMDLPLSGGPDRFYGLPGLILEIDINDGGKIIAADKIDLKPVATDLTPSKKIKGKKINTSAFEKIIADHFRDKIKEEQYPYWGIPY